MVREIFPDEITPGLGDKERVRFQIMGRATIKASKSEIRKKGEIKLSFVQCFVWCFHCSGKNEIHMHT